MRSNMLFIKTAAITAAFAVMLAALSGCTEAEPSDAQSYESGESSEVSEIIPEPEYIYDVKDVSNRAITIHFDEVQPSEGLIVTDAVLSLADGTDSAGYVSDVIDAGEFTKLCASFNGTVSGGTVETLVQFEKTASVWSDWYSYGVFSSEKGVSRSASRSDSDAKMDIDTLIPKMKATGNVRVKLVLGRAADGTSPEIRTLTVSSNKAQARKAENALPDDVEIGVPAKSQMNIEKIGSSICSPTSTAMVLEHLGVATSQEVFAYEARDYGAEIFGNWMFNVVAASAHGVSAYLDFFGENDIKYALSQGVPVVCSIHTTSSSALEGSPMAYSSGHLVCVTGYITKDGIDYFIVNDPAVYTPTEVRHLYRCDQFMDAFTGLVYIIQNYEES